jgi:hypothetical protein
MRDFKQSKIVRYREGYHIRGNWPIIQVVERTPNIAVPNDRAWGKHEAKTSRNARRNRWN